MTGLIDMLLVVARRRPLQFDEVDAAAFLREAIAPLQAPEATASPIDIVATGSLRVPQRETLLLLRHTIGKLGWPASGTMLSMRLDGRTLEIATHARDDNAMPLRSDSGGAGALAQRLATQLDWRLLHASPERIAFELPADARIHTTQPS